MTLGARLPARLLLLLVWGAALLPASWASAASGEPGEPVVPRLVIEAEEGTEGFASRVRDLDPSRLAATARLTGLDSPGPPIRVRVVSPVSTAARLVPPWVAGYAQGGEIVLISGRTPSYPDRSIEELVHHEVAHVLVHRAARGHPVPRWFNEGVALAAGRAWGLGDTTRFMLESLRGRRVPLAFLDDRFAGGHADSAGAYAIAGAFVRDLIERHGPEVTGEILAAVGRGMAFPAAFSTATGESLSGAESRFWERRGGWRRWIPLLTSSVALWLGVTLLFLFATWRRRRRDAEIERRWELEEEAVRLRRELREVRESPGSDEPRVF